MDPKEYIASGILELYVAGALSEEENREVHAAMEAYPEIKEEVIKIESAIVQLTAGVAPEGAAQDFSAIRSRIASTGNRDNVVPMPGRSMDRLRYSGWAAAVLLALGCLWLFQQNSRLNEQVRLAEQQQQELEQQIAAANNSLEESNALIAVLRDKNILEVELAGQEVYPTAYASVYWDKASDNIYLDAKGLPDPPPGKVYQVWSLTLDPLTPTSLGTLDDFTTDDNKIFNIGNPNASEAFGITLEPEGGSASPTLEQLYTLGVV